MKKGLTRCWVTWIYTSVLPLTYCVTLGKFLPLSGLLFLIIPSIATRTTQDQKVPRP